MKDKVVEHLQERWGWVVGGGVLAVVGVVVGLWVYTRSQEKRIAEAEISFLSQQASPEGLVKVALDYPNTLWGQLAALTVLDRYYTADTTPADLEPLLEILKKSEVPFVKAAYYSYRISLSEDMGEVERTLELIKEAKGALKGYESLEDVFTLREAEVLLRAGRYSEVVALLREWDPPVDLEVEVKRILRIAKAFGGG